MKYATWGPMLLCFVKIFYMLFLGGLVGLKGNHELFLALFNYSFASFCID